MQTLRDIKVVVQGQTYTGSFNVEDGAVCTMSAYGSARAKATGDPKVIAKTLLTQIVEKWRS